MFEELIVEYCSPTLAGIKTGSLFSVRIRENTEINKDLGRINEVLSEKGIRVLLLKKTEEYALIYVYRPDHLKKDLNDPKARNILKKRGYESSHPDGCIDCLTRRLMGERMFPHEIGLFLGYPPSDVECFIQNPCDGVKCCGCWKAYSEPEKAMDTFRRYRECTNVYREMKKNGKSLAQLAVKTDSKMCRAAIQNFKEVTQYE